MHTKDTPYSSIENIFSRLQHEFLSAVIGGQQTTAAFATHISELESRTELLIAEHDGRSGDGLFALAHKSSLGVATLASSFIDFEVEADTITAGLDSEIAKIFDSLSIDGPSSELILFLSSNTWKLKVRRLIPKHKPP